MTNSILDDVKKSLNIDPSYTAFDGTIILHINTVFSILNGLGFGPTSGFAISDNTVTWDNYGDIGSDRTMNSAKTYMCLRVRMMFDPPTTSFVIDAMNKQIEEFEWRLNVKRENMYWTDPNPPAPPPPTQCEMF